jgi:hypothetical protein
VSVGINASGHSDSVINTKWLGPCIGFIWSLNLATKPNSILDHYTFPKDESILTVERIIILLLNRFLLLLHKYFIDSLLFNEKNEYTINNLYQIATGGDYIEGLYFRQACAALYSNEIDLNQFTTEKDILYFYIQLKHRVIILNPVAKCLSSKTIRKG